MSIASPELCHDVAEPRTQAPYDRISSGTWPDVAAVQREPPVEARPERLGDVVGRGPPVHLVDVGRGPDAPPRLQVRRSTGCGSMCSSGGVGSPRPASCGRDGSPGPRDTAYAPPAATAPTAPRSAAAPGQGTWCVRGGARARLRPHAGPGS